MDRPRADSHRRQAPARSSAALLSAVLALLVLAASCAGEQAAAPSGATSATTARSGRCAWAVKAGKDVQNVAYPDTSATYWALSYSLAPGERLSLKGRFPDARYMSFITYPVSGGALAVLTDRDIAPDPGSTNPFRGDPKRPVDQQRYTVEVSGDTGAAPNRITAASVPGSPASSNTTAAAAGTTAVAASRDAALGTGGANGTIGTVIYRVYVPASDSDPAGGAGVPDVSLVAADGSSTPVAPCSAPGAGPNVESLVNAYGPATDTPAPASPVFIRPGRNGNNLYPNPDNIYVATIVKHEPGQVVVVRGKAPTFPDTRSGEAITGREQVRFWSLCTNEYRKPYPVSFCKRDDETALDAEGRFTFVISTPADRPANATPENGATWIDIGSVSVNTLLLFRHMLAEKGFSESATNLAPGALATSTMGDYAPRGVYCAKAAFESGGAAACGI